MPGSIGNNQLERMGRKWPWLILIVLSYHVSAETEVNYQKPQKNLKF
jgi:hypothetical protein